MQPNRMKLWRDKKLSKEAGLLQQTCGWCPKEEVSVVRRLLELICEQSERGRSLRIQLATDFLAENSRIVKSAGDVPLRKGQLFSYGVHNQEIRQCRVVHHRNGKRIQFAFIRDGVSSPTEVFASVATMARHRFYPHADPADIEWFDVIPRNGITVFATTVYRVTMSSLNGIYQDPAWSDVLDHADLAFLT